MMMMGLIQLRIELLDKVFLMQLMYFNFCESLVPDVMHDILEGCLQYELKLFLQHSVLTNHYFTVCYSNLQW